MTTKNKKKRWLPPKIPIIDFKKYRGKQIAVFNGKIVAEGRSTLEVLKKAKAKYPKRKTEEFLLISVPRERVVIYFYEKI